MDKVIELLTEIKESVDAKRDDIFYTRDQAQVHYGFSKREVDKVFNTILKDKVTDIGKCQRLAKVHIDKMLMDGVKVKYV